MKSVLADRYTIERKLGEGGMATVYLAHDVKHDRKVAIKVLRPELAAVLGAERFVQEIKTTANLQHPNILPLFDSGEADSFLFYVMPFIDGETLREKLNREKQLGIEEAVKITTEVADALDYAHRHNVIHRDIKPENILLHDGRPMVADFGIALAVSAAAGGRMTETGLSLGTPHYMSPEQATAEKHLTNRSDIYSLGAVLYEMLTGDPPHTGSSAQQIIMKIVTDEARPVTELRRSVPPHVAAATAKSLEKLAADRFASAKEFAEALTNPAFALPTMETAAAAAHKGGLRTIDWRVAAPAAAVIAAVAGAVGWLLHPEAPPPPLTRFFVEAPEGVRGINGLLSSAMTLSPDGTRLVYVGINTGRDRRLYLRSMSGLETTAIAGTEGATSPFFSPDGRWVGFLADGQLKKVALAGGPPIKVADVEERLEGVSWGEGDVILYGLDRHPALWRVPATGGEPEILIEPDSSGEYTRPDVLPGGQAALFSVELGGQNEGIQIGTVSIETGDTTMLVTGTHGRYAHPNHLIYTGADGSLLVQPFDPARRRAREVYRNR